MASSGIYSLAMIDLRSVHPADYNPREIAPEQFDALKASVRRFGCIIPLIVNPDNLTLIAGHQRTRAMLSVGMDSAPAFYARNVSPGDEIIFNQVHNRTEFMAVSKARCRTPVNADGFCQLPSSFFSFSNDMSAEVVIQICRLLELYGNVLSTVVCGGEVVAGSAYAKAATLQGLGVNAYVVSDASILHDVRAAFSADYGRFSYSKIERRTYIQGLAQLNRATSKEAGKKQYASILYETKVLPWLARNPMSILDFGCGKGAYISRIPNGIGLEFYPHNGRAINLAKATRMIDATLASLRLNGRPGCVVCDSVLNSVDSPEAERAVLRCCNALSRSGIVFLSGRDFALEDRVTRQTTRRVAASRRSMYFYDEQLFSAIYRAGSWFFQHFHTEQSFRAVCDECGLAVDIFTTNGRSFQAQCRRVRELPLNEIETALRFEFSLPLPGGGRYQYGDAAIAAYRAAIKKESE